MSEEIKELLIDLEQYIAEPNSQDINGEYYPPRELDQCEARLLVYYITKLQLENELLHFIIKEVRKTLNNKRSILTTQLLNGEYCNYEEMLYQVDEEIREILDKVGETDDSKRDV